MMRPVILCTRSLYSFSRRCLLQSSPVPVRTATSTVDQEEMRKFRELDQDFWWRSPAGAPLRAMNQLRIPLVRDSVRRSISPANAPLRDVTILEIGSGGGLVSEPLARLGADVTGIDPLHENVEIANKHLTEQSSDLVSRLRYITSSAEEFASQSANNNAFDAVIASEVLEHVSDVGTFVESVAKLLKPGGRFILTTINQTLASQLLAIYLAENVLNLVPRGTHSYEKLVSKDGLKLLLEQNGFTIQLETGMAYNPLTNNWSWCPWTGIHFAIVAVRI